MTTAERLDQRMTALDKANRVRVARANDKRDIFAGRLDPAVIARELPDHWQTATVADLLLSINRVGRVRAQKWCVAHHVSLTSLLCSLSEPRRELLAQQVAAWAHYRRWVSTPQALK